MLYFCTYFDQKFLPRALALYESLSRHAGEFRLWALCMDDVSYQALRQLDLPGLEPIALSELEWHDPELLVAKQDRSRIEYYFTCTPSLPLYVLERWPEVDQLTYLDADLFFFDDPRLILAEIGDASVAIIPHRFSQRVRDREQFGRYNVGWLSFRRDENGLACLRWWRERCQEWCYARAEGGKYADQKYLDEWSLRFQNVHEVQHKGANLGPWNLASYRVTERGGKVWVDEQPLVFFHFSSFLQVAPWLYNTNFAYWHVRPGRAVRRGIVGPYIEALKQVSVPVVPTSATVEVPQVIPQQADRPAGGRVGWLLRKLRGLGRIGGGLLAQDHLVVVRGHVL